MLAPAPQTYCAILDSEVCSLIRKGEILADGRTKVFSLPPTEGLLGTFQVCMARAAFVN
jgi:hypothetical protein